MWGSAKADPPKQEESEDQNLTHEQRMAKYPKPMVAFDRDGVLFETNGTPIKREDAVPIVDAFKAGAVAVLCNKKEIKYLKKEINNILTSENVRLAKSVVFNN